MENLYRNGYVSQYLRKGFGRTLKMLNSKQGILVDWKTYKLLDEYNLNPEVDNKSVYSPEILFERLNNYFVTSDVSRPEDDLYKRVLSRAYRVFGGDGSLRSISLLDEIELRHSFKGDKSSGAPYFTSKDNSFHKDLSLAKGMVEGSRKSLPCIAYHRVQHGKAGPKVRLVWGYPFSMTLLEATFARPLINQFLKMRSPIAFGLRKHELASRLTPIDNDKFSISVDFSRFDSNLPEWLINDAFMILKTWFTFAGDDARIYSIVRNYFINTPIVMPDCGIYKKNHGIPSGSYFTQLVGSICNFIIINYCVERETGHSIKLNKQLFLGDDSVFSLSHGVSVRNLSLIARSTFNSIIHPEKTMVSFNGRDPVHFLGHSWVKGIVDRPERETAMRVVFQENRVKTNDYRRYVAGKVLSLTTDSRSAWKVFRRVNKLRGNHVTGYSGLKFEEATSGLTAGRLLTTFERDLQRGCVFQLGVGLLI